MPPARLLVHACTNTPLPPMRGRSSALPPQRPGSSHYFQFMPIMIQLKGHPIHHATINHQECDIIREYLIAGQILVHECVVSSDPKTQTRELQKLDAVCSASMFQPLLECIRAFDDAGRCEILIEILPYDVCCTHIISPDDKILQTHYWNLTYSKDGYIQLSLWDFYTLGIPEHEPYDYLVFHMQTLAHEINCQISEKINFTFDPVAARISFNLLEWLMQLILSNHSEMQAEIKPAFFKITNKENAICVQYDRSESFSGMYTGLVPRGPINSYSFYKDTNEITRNNAAQTVSPSMPSPNRTDSSVLNTSGKSAEIKPADDLDDDEEAFWSLSDLSGVNDALDLSEVMQGEAAQKPVIIDSDKGCMTLDALHNTIRENKTIEPEVASLVLDEVRSNLPPEMYKAVLYFLYICDNSLAQHLIFSIIESGISKCSSFFVLYILYELYTSQKNDNMRIATLQRIIRCCHSESHSFIKFSLIYIDLVCEAHGLFEQAVRLLKELHPVVQSVGSISEKIAFAQSCRHAEYLEGAIYALYDFINRASSSEDIISLVTALVPIMIDAHVSVDRIEELGRFIFETIPDHADLLIPLIQYLMSVGECIHASQICQACLNKSMQYWMMFQSMEHSLLDMKSKLRCGYYHDKALQFACLLEDIYESIGYSASLYNVLNQHLMLEPSAFAILNRMLPFLEIGHAHFELAQVCIEFLQKNAGNILPNDEIAIQLALHTLYDRDMGLPDKAEQCLNRARELSVNDPRVIMAEIERYQRRNQLEEQVGLRLALIGAVSPQAAVEQTLALVQLYEQLNADPVKAIEILRQTNSRVPNNPQILQELRRYLRKSRQFFELATVLEKLAKVTKDLQMRKSILLEASEVHAQLGNKQVSESLYHEAQLCSPINPENVAELNYAGKRPAFGPNQFNDKPIAGFGSNSLTSALLTSQENQLQSDTGKSNTHTNEGDAIESPAQPVLNKDIFSTNPNLTPMPLSQSLEDARRNDHLSSRPRIAHSSYDENAPIETQIAEARRHGSSEALLDRLLFSISDKPEEEQPPRILQEIGCIYLYDKNDPENARTYLERACALSSEIAYGEQTLNALEMIYQATQQYKELGDVYEKKCEILTVIEERRKYEIRLAQLRYERLGETQKAIDTLNELLERAPNNETALQLLAQIYTDTQNLSRAIETLEKISPLLRPNSKIYTQHMMRLSSMYLEAGEKQSAKDTLRALLKNDYIDKLMVIESFKRICRADDEWEELLSILREEVAFYLHIPSADCELESVDWLSNTELNVGGATHAMREYADILYYKLNRIGAAVSMFLALNKVHPDDGYLRNVILDIAVQHPENAEAVAAMLDLYTSREVPQASDSSDGIRQIYSDIELSFDSICNGDYTEAASRLTGLSEQVSRIHRKSLPTVISVLQKHLELRQHPSSVSSTEP